MDLHGASLPAEGFTVVLRSTWRACSVPAMKAQVLVVDDETAARASLVRLLRHSHRLAVVGEATDGVDAARQMRGLQPDVVLMDIAMPRADGGQGLALIKSRDPDAKVVAMSRLCDPQTVWRMLMLGADGFAAKSSSLGEVEEVVDAALQGRIAGTATVAHVVEHFLHGSTSLDAPPMLTSRQMEVLQGLGEGLGDEDLATRLCVSKATVRDHIRGLLAAFGVETRLQVVIRAAGSGLVDLRLSAVNGHEPAV